jgi:predicted permease
MTDDRRRLRLRNLLVGAQVALALTLAVGSALMLQSFWRLAAVDPGFDPTGVLTVEVGMPGNRAPRHQQIYAQLVERVGAIPGVSAASAASSVPLDPAAHLYPMAIDDAGTPTGRSVSIKFIMPGYFETMRTGVVDRPAVTTGLWNAVLVSSSFARRYFPGQNPIGRPIRRLDSDGREVTMFDPVTKTRDPITAWTIGGVVADVREESLRLEPPEIVYVPMRDPAVERSIVPTNMTLVVRADLAAVSSTAGVVRQVIRDVDSALSVGRIRPMSAIVDDSVAAERFLAALLAIAATASLFLGATGIYGVAAAAVRRREQEFAIRITLGARPMQIVGRVCRESASFVLGGAVAGVAAALSSTRALRAFLYEVSVVDPVTIAAAAAAVIALALAATLLPARRATRANPVAVLRG